VTFIITALHPFTEAALLYSQVTVAALQIVNRTSQLNTALLMLLVSEWF
jgi:hypothetical protein